MKNNKVMKTLVSTACAAVLAVGLIGAGPASAASAQQNSVPAPSGFQNLQDLQSYVEKWLQNNGGYAFKYQIQFPGAYQATNPQPTTPTPSKLSAFEAGNVQAAAFQACTVEACTIEAGNVQTVDRNVFEPIGLCCRGRQAGQPGTRQSGLEAADGKCEIVQYGDG